MKILNRVERLVRNQVRHFIFNMRSGIWALTTFWTDNFCIIINFTNYLFTYCTWKWFCIVYVQSESSMVTSSIKYNITIMKTCQVLQYQIKQIFHFDTIMFIVDFVVSVSWQSWNRYIWGCNWGCNYIGNSIIFSSWKRTSRTTWLRWIRMELQECTCMCGCKRLDFDNICSVCKADLCKIIYRLIRWILRAYQMLLKFNDWQIFFII